MDETPAAPDAAAGQAQITLELAQGVLLAGVNHAIQTVSAGLRGLDAAGGNLTLPRARVGLGSREPDEPNEDDLEVVRTRILAGGLRDCVDAIGGALVAAYRECQLWAQPGTIVQQDDGNLHLTATTTGAWWNETFVTGAERFERLTLPEKIARLEQLGLARPAYAEHVLSLNAARNCLTHRGGVVGPRDLKAAADEGLEVTWRRMELSAMHDGHVRPLDIGSTVEEGETVRVEVAATSRVFALGERITFSEDDFSEMALTFMLYAQQITAGILEMQRRRFESQGNSASGTTA